MSSRPNYGAPKSPNAESEESDERVDDPYNSRVARDRDREIDRDTDRDRARARVTSVDIARDTNGESEPNSSSSSSNRQTQASSSSPVQQSNARNPIEFPATYDSMSTIIEVESEDSESGNFGQTGLQRDAASSTESGRAAGLLGRISPIGSGRWGSEKNAFSGTLNALAQQVERLRRSSISDKQASKGGHEQSQHAQNYSDSGEESIDDPRGQSRVQESTYDRKLERVDSRASETNTNQPNPLSVNPSKRSPIDASSVQGDRANSAESLMMIAISPMVSPRVKASRVEANISDSNFPSEDIRRVVEVSNKSTMTAIDLKLMAQMVEKYFVERCEQATQSIEFDCLDEFESTAEGSGLKSRPRGARGLSQASGAGALKAQTRNVSVGTEKFSRERFSLLPITKTRSTQTRPNLMDTDIGVSETRRFKLSHLDLIRSPARTIDTRTLADASDESGADETQKSRDIEPKISIVERKSTGEIQLDSLSLSNEQEASGTNTTRARQDTRSPVNSARHNKKLDQPQKSTDIKIKKPEQANDRDSIDSSANEDKSSEEASEMRPHSTTPTSDASNDRAESDDIAEAKARLPAKDKQKQQKQQQQQPLAPIPTVKTELRLIIEVKNSRERQISELKSQSTISSDGKLSKTTDIQTSKHLALTPRQVLERLRSAGRAHSLLYQAGPKSGAKSAPSMNLNDGRKIEPSLQPGDGDKSWRQVSKSSVRSDIETDTKRKASASEHRDKAGARNSAYSKGQNRVQSDQVLVLTSDALIEHRSDDKSAIELKTRAAKQYKSPLGKTTREVVLVDSEAAFDERDICDQYLEDSEAKMAATSGDSLDNDERLQHPLPLSLSSSISHNKPTTLQHTEQANKVMGPIRQRIRDSKQTGDDDDDGDDGDDDNNVVTRMLPEPPSQFGAPSWNPSFTPDQVQQTRAHSPRRVHTVQFEPVGAANSLGPKTELAPSSARSTPTILKRRQTTFELEEESEDRHSISRNGRLVYDDRIRQHRYESQRASSSPLLNEQVDPVGPFRGSTISPRSSTPSPSSRPQRSSILRPYQQQPGHQPSLRSTNVPQQQQQQQQQQQPVQTKPHNISAQSRSSPQSQLLERTSNLSSDPETMDSGFAQSAGGSGSGLNQLSNAGPKTSARHLSFSSRASPLGRPTRFGPYHEGSQMFQSPPPPPLPQASSATGIERHLRSMASLDPDSIGFNFMDEDDDDELVKQLGGSTPALTTTNREQQTSHNKPSERRAKVGLRVQPDPALDADETSNRKSRAAKANYTSDQLIEIPAGFRGSSSGLASPNDTELTTRLTRTTQAPGRLANQDKRRTQTKLEQTIQSGLGSNRQSGKIRTQITFDSDSDSLTGSGRSKQENSELAYGKSRSSLNREDEAKAKIKRSKNELITHTKYLRYQADEPATKKSQLEPRGSATKTKTSKESPSDETSKRVKNLVGAGKKPETGDKRNNEHQSEKVNALDTSRCRPNHKESSGSIMDGDYDYSFCVNRMRDQKVDKRINQISASCCQKIMPELGSHKQEVEHNCFIHSKDSSALLYSERYRDCVIDEPQNQHQQQELKKSGPKLSTIGGFGSAKSDDLTLIDLANQIQPDQSIMIARPTTESPTSGASDKSTNTRSQLVDRRCSLRKQSSSNQLDSCGSSDSGQSSAVHSISSSLAASSIASIATSGSASSSRVGGTGGCSCSSSASSVASSSSVFSTSISSNLLSSSSVLAAGQRQAAHNHHQCYHNHNPTSRRQCAASQHQHQHTQNRGPNEQQELEIRAHSTANRRVAGRHPLELRQLSSEGACFASQLSGGQACRVQHLAWPQESKRPQEDDEELEHLLAGAKIAKSGRCFSGDEMVALLDNDDNNNNNNNGDYKVERDDEDVNQMDKPDAQFLATTSAAAAAAAASTTTTAATSYTNGTSTATTAATSTTTTTTTTTTPPPPLPVLKLEIVSQPTGQSHSRGQRANALAQQASSAPSAKDHPKDSSIPIESRNYHQVCRLIERLEFYQTEKLAAEEEQNKRKKTRQQLSLATNAKHAPRDLTKPSYSRETVEAAKAARAAAAATDADLKCQVAPDCDHNVSENCDLERLFGRLMVVRLEDTGSGEPKGEDRGGCTVSEQLDGFLDQHCKHQHQHQQQQQQQRKRKRRRANDETSESSKIHLPIDETQSDITRLPATTCSEHKQEAANHLSGIGNGDFRLVGAIQPSTSQQQMRRKSNETRPQDLYWQQASLAVESKSKNRKRNRTASRAVREKGFASKRLSAYDSQLGQISWLEPTGPTTRASKHEHASQLANATRHQFVFANRSQLESGFDLGDLNLSLASRVQSCKSNRSYAPQADSSSSSSSYSSSSSSSTNPTEVSIATTNRLMEPEIDTSSCDNYAADEDEPVDQSTSTLVMECCGHSDQQSTGATSRDHLVVASSGGHHQRMQPSGRSNLASSNSEYENSLESNTENDDNDVDRHPNVDTSNEARYCNSRCYCNPQNSTTTLNVSRSSESCGLICTESEWLLRDCCGDSKSPSNGDADDDNGNSDSSSGDSLSGGESNGSDADSSDSGDKQPTGACASTVAASYSGARFWSLVASSSDLDETDLSCRDDNDDDDDEDEDEDEKNSATHDIDSSSDCRFELGSQATETSDEKPTCSLAKLIQAAQANGAEFESLGVENTRRCFGHELRPNVTQDKRTPIVRPNSASPHLLGGGGGGGGHSLRIGQVRPATATDNLVRLNSIDEEEICLSSGTDESSSASNANSGSSTSEASYTIDIRPTGTTLRQASAEMRKCDENEQISDMIKRAESIDRENDAQSNLANVIRSIDRLREAEEKQEAEEVAKAEVELEQEQEKQQQLDTKVQVSCESGSDNDKTRSVNGSQQGDQDEDDYFYDDELVTTLINCQRYLQSSNELSPTNRLLSQHLEQQQSNQAAAAKLLQSNDTLDASKLLHARAPSTSLTINSADVRPLLVLAPSLRRVSCPVGQPGSLLMSHSLRQLLNPTQSGLPAPQVIDLTSIPLCMQCLKHRQFGCPTAHNSPTHTNSEPQTQTNCWDRKSSQNSIAGYSDYFSSFDQTTEQTQTAGASLMSIASQDAWRDLATFESTKRLGLRSNGGFGVATSGSMAAYPASSGSLRRRCSCCRSQSNYPANCPNLATNVGVPELRRQSTITGFDHQKYTAHRSPSLCLPQAWACSNSNARRNFLPAYGAANLGTNSNLSAANRSLSPNRFLSPTHSTCGSNSSSSPSPTNWLNSNGPQQQHSQPQAYQYNSQQQQQQQQHQFTSSQQQQQSPQVQAQQVASQRNYAPASSHHNPFAQSRHLSSSGQRRPTGFGRARLESLESDRSSSPSWSASTSSLRSSLGSVYSLISVPQAPQSNSSLTNWQPPKLSAAAGSPNIRLPLSASSFCSTKQKPKLEALNQNAHQSQHQQQQHPQSHHQHHQLQHQIQQQHQQQQVYFFLCCCQRRSQTDEQADSSASNGAPSGRVQQQQPQSQSQADRRVSLVARSPIADPVSAGDRSRRRSSQRANDNNLQARRVEPQQISRPRSDTISTSCQAAGSRSTVTDDPVSSNEKMQDAELDDDAKMLARAQCSTTRELDTQPVSQAEQLGPQLSRLLEQLDSSGLRGISRISNHERDLLARIGARIDSFLGPNEETRTARLPQGTQTESLIDIDNESDAQLSDNNREQENDDPITTNQRRQISIRSTNSRKVRVSGHQQDQPSFDNRPESRGQTSKKRRHQNEPVGSSSQQQDHQPKGAPKDATAKKVSRISDDNSIKCDDFGGSSLQPASIFISQVNDRSLAQAHYLYSSLTSYSSALLAAAGRSAPAKPVNVSSTATKANEESAIAENKSKEQQQQQQHQQQHQRQQQQNQTTVQAQKQQWSPSRSAAGLMQRKQAQFVVRQQELEREKAQRLQLEKQQQQQQLQQKQQEHQHQQQHKQRLSFAQTSSQPDDEPSDNSSGDDADAFDEQLADRGRRLSGRSEGRDEKDQSIGNDSNDEVRQMPSIAVEIQWDSQQTFSPTRPSLSSQNSLGSSGSEFKANTSQMRDTSSCLDPAMHALRAQGADLDTGNGNFIMANRRRRSVHQVQLSQQIHLQNQYQQHQQLQSSQAAPLPILRSQMTLASLHHPSSILRSAGKRLGSLGPSRLSLKHKHQQQYQRDQLISEESATGCQSIGPNSRALRATSSIDEAASPAHVALDSSSIPRPRFVSEPAKYFEEQQQQAALSGSFPSNWFGPSAASASPSSGHNSSLNVAIPSELDESLGSRTSDTSVASPDALHLAKRIQKTSEIEDVTKPSLQLESPIQTDQPSQSPDINLDSVAKTREYLLNESIRYDLDELESPIGLLSNLYEWNYPIFMLSAKYGESILSKLSYRIFLDSGFFDTFKIPLSAFFEFFHALEEGYYNNPYHNRVHAADVLHAVYYLTSQPIENFRQVPLDLIEQYDELLVATESAAATIRSQDRSQTPEVGDCDDAGLSKLRNDITAIVVAAAAAAADSERPNGIMGANLTALEVMALYTAAAMHDFQHPGRTNSFLVATNSPLALLYNDRSVLENHHSAASWALFHSGSKFNWLCNLEKDEFKRFRFMIIELILATDLMRHYELVSAFNKKLSKFGRHNIDWFGESDRLLVMEIIIKLADVNGPMKEHQLHCQWTDRIASEFYEQGDEERALNLPVSLYMDRSDPRLPELQKSFINHLVGPLSHSYAAAGFFPQSTDSRLLAIGQADSSIQSEDTDLEATEFVYDQTKYWLIDQSKVSRLNKNFLRCTQTWNLRNNFLYWDGLSTEREAQLLTSSDKNSTKSSDK